MTPTVFLYGIGPMRIGPMVKGVLLAVIEGEVIETFTSAMHGVNVVERAAYLLGGKARLVGIHAYKNIVPFGDLFHERSLAGYYASTAEIPAPYLCGDPRGCTAFVIGTNGLILPTAANVHRAA